MTENKLSFEFIAQNKFEQARNSIRQNVFDGSLFLPPDQERHLKTILSNTKLVGPDNLRAIMNHYNSGFFPKRVMGKINRMTTHRTNPAIYLPTVPIGNLQEMILIDTDFIGQKDISMEDVTGILLEELAHAHAKVSPLQPLSEVEIDSMHSLFPFESKDELIRSLSKTKRILLDDQNLSDIDIRNVVYYRKGFRLYFFEKNFPTQSGYLGLPATIAQLAFEEMRASILQSIFLAKLHGKKLESNASLSDQLQQGQAHMEEEVNRFTLPPIAYKQIAGLGFMSVFADLYPSDLPLFGILNNTEKKFQDVATRLYQDDLKDFLHYLQEEYPVAEYTFFLFSKFLIDTIKRQLSAT